MTFALMEDGAGTVHTQLEEKTPSPMTVTIIDRDGNVHSLGNARLVGATRMEVEDE